VESHPHLEVNTHATLQNAAFPRQWSLVRDSSLTITIAAKQTNVGSGNVMVLTGGIPRSVVEIADPDIAVCVNDLLNGANIGSDGLRQGVARWLADRAFTHPVPHDLAVRGDGLPHASTDGDGSFVSSTTPIGVADVSLLVPVYNRRNELSDLLTSFGPLLAKLGEVIVVDDGSTDGSGDLAQEFGATVIRHDHPGGPARARNAGLDAVRTAFVFMLDSDCTVDSDATWLDELLAHAADESVALIAPRVMSAGGSTLAERFQGARSALDQGPVAGYIGPGKQVGTVPSAALLMRTSVAHALQGFDASMKAAEDTDFVWRTVDAKWRLRYVPSAVVSHHDPALVRKMLKTHRGYGQWVAPLENKHGPRVRSTRVDVSTPIAIISTLTLHPVGLIGAAVASAWPLRRELAARRGLEGARLQAAKTVARTHVGGALRLSQTSIRCWLPITAALSLVSSRVRVVTLVGIGLRGASRIRRRPHADPASDVSALEYIAISVLDDAAHCRGVWEGCWRTKSIGALLPARLHPTRRTALYSQHRNADGVAMLNERDL
jgi:mycofactocin glycosyltransferase